MYRGKVSRLTVFSACNRLLAGLLLLSASLSHADTAINTTLFGNKAVEGYDVVAYFTENRAVEGEEKFSHEWHGAKWYFSSAEHLEAFKADPERYAPQYGGYCAYGAARDKLVDIEPEQFAIHNGKLYLNYSAGVAETWRQDPDMYIEKADANWPELSKE